MRVISTAHDPCWFTTFPRLTFFLDCVSGLHASHDVICDMAVQDPCAWVLGFHVYRLEGSREQLKGVRAVRAAQLWKDPESLKVISAHP